MLSLLVLNKNVFSRRRDLFSQKYSSSLVRFISTDSTCSNSFAISYLINTCGVPKQKAISSLKVFNLKSSENPDLVLAFLRDNNFSNTHISKLTGTRPALLLSSVDKTLKPKFEFFKSLGISGPDFADIVCRNSSILLNSLEKRIIPCFNVIRGIVCNDAKLLAMLKRSTRVLREDPQKNLLPNVALLRAQGVPADNIAKFLIAQPLVFLKPTSRFSESVEEVKKMKFDPSQYMFLIGLHGLACMSKSSLEAKFDLYRSWGLSDDEVQFIFRKNPRCMMISEKNIMSTMNYFVNEMGYTPSLIAKHADVIMFSLERRIIPRCLVIRVLTMKGLLKKEHSLDSLMKMPEKAFLNKYVTRFEKEVPELLSTYQRKEM